MRRKGKMGSRNLVNIEIEVNKSYSKSLKYKAIFFTTMQNFVIL